MHTKELRFASLFSSTFIDRVTCIIRREVVERRVTNDEQVRQT